MKNRQKGFMIPLIITIIALLAIGGGIYFYFNNTKDTNIIDNTEVPINTSTSSGKCGDGICGIVEKQKNICPVDCLKISTTSNTANGTTTNNISGKKLTFIKTYDITPGGLIYNPWRMNIEKIKDKFYVMFNKGGISGFALIVLDNNFKQLNYLDMYSRDPNYSGDAKAPTDLRTFKDDNNNLFYAYENSVQVTKPELVTDDCEFNKDGVVLFDTTSLKLLKNNDEIIWGCVKTSETVKILKETDFYNKPATDDPTPFYYNGKYYVLNRAAGGPLLNITELDNNLIEKNHKTIDLTPYIENIPGSTNSLSPNTIVEIDNKIYLISGVYGTNSIYILQLASDFSSAVGSAIKLTDHPEPSSGPRSSRYSNGILYVTYAAYNSNKAACKTNCQTIYVEAFDPANKFASLGRAFVTNEAKRPEVALEISNNKVYVAYDLPSQILIAEFEWK